MTDALFKEEIKKMGMYDTIEFITKVKNIKGEVWDWQTKALGRNMAYYQSGDEQLKGVTEINVIGSIHIKGKLILDGKGNIQSFQLPNKPKRNSGE